MNAIFGSLSILGFAILIWQWVAARRFPLHQRSAERQPGANAQFQPAVTLLKSLKGADAATEDCLRSWFAQNYGGETQILFGVISAEDPVCEIVRKLMREFPQRDAQLVVVPRLIGANAKVSKLAELEKSAKHEVLVVSDADVRVPPDFLANAVVPLGAPEVGLINCFYRLANPATLAMQWEAIAMNADFWSQVLQSQTLKPLDFALGAVMLVRRRCLEEIGGFKSLADCLADDYQLGNRIARKGHRIVLCPIVVECWDPPMGWSAVWKHQLRWARTIRVCQPAPYFFSILSNAGFWALLWLIQGVALTLRALHLHFSSARYVFDVWDLNLHVGLLIGGLFILARIGIASNLQRRLTQSSRHRRYLWLVPIKDVLHTAIWLCAFVGNRIEWRGQMYCLRRDGTLVRD
ncbi:MAG TPA: glycosyltransferase [Verrucomicrobiae bacterium]|nr:glycosyltransferase [Verrucomicrobiae bacterium]